MDDDATVVEAPEDEDPADGVTAPLVPEPVPPGVTGGALVELLVDRYCYLVTRPTVCDRQLT